MLKGVPEYLKFPLVLTVVPVISAASLAGLYALTLPAKEAMAAKETEDALKVVFPEAAGFELKHARVDGKPFEYRVAKRDGETLGFVAVGQAMGYSSQLRVMVGVDRQLDVQGVKILYQNETPGLGTKVDEVNSRKTWWTVLTGTSPDESRLRPWFQVQFNGKRIPVKVDKDGGTIESITGATISSRAVCNAVDKAVDRLKKAVGS